MTLRRLGRAKEAADSLKPISDSLEIIENADYLKLLRLYQGKLQPLDIADRANDNLSSATLGYGLGNWLLYNHQRAEAKKIWRGVTSGNQWASFGYIAAEADLKRASPAAKPR
jgi:hypothetical protein